MLSYHRIISLIHSSTLHAAHRSFVCRPPTLHFAKDASQEYLFQDYQGAWTNRQE